MRDRTGWTRGEGGLGRNKKLVEFSRPCAACGKLFSILVTQKIASGKADSNSFGLKNCELHRRGKIVDELETLRAELAVLKRRDQELFAENMALKAKLAAVDPYLLLGLGPREDPDTATGQNKNKKMPWE